MTKLLDRVDAERLEAIKVLLEVLDYVEWCGSTWGDAACPFCGGLRDHDLPEVPGRYPLEPKGHKPDCNLVLIRNHYA